MKAQGRMRLIMEKQTKKTVQIDRQLFVDLCQYFELINQTESTKEELEKNIKIGLQEKIKTIQKRFAYQEMLKAQGTDQYEEALYNYLKQKQ